MKSSLAVGLKGHIEHRVEARDLVNHYNPGGAAVLASPWMLYLMEWAAYQAIAPHLDDGEDSVGVGFRFEHLAPTPEGHLVIARAEVLQLEGPRVVFRVEASDERELIGQGEHVRAVIDRQRFERRLRRKVEA